METAYRDGINMQEMVDLATGLKERNIPYTVKTRFYGLQIRCEGWDAICTPASYGYEDGLIEIMGLMVDEDDVVGNLTAQEILDYIDEHK